MKEIKNGQIYIVDSDHFLTSGRSNKFNRPIKLQKNELIEIRYPFEWHFRTIDNNYWHAEPNEILKHCSLFANIWKNVNFNNRCDLSEIINLSLCDFENNNSYVWAKNFDYKYLKEMKLDKLLSSLENKHKKPEQR